MVRVRVRFRVKVRVRVISSTFWTGVSSLSMLVRVWIFSDGPPRDWLE